MPVAEDYRRHAARQRTIARTIPLPSVRQRFLASAERFENLARAEQELVERSPDET